MSCRLPAVIDGYGYEVRSRNEFWDLEPYLRLYRGQIGTRP
ncbi:MAG TPA: hypothetical protein VEW48_26055 [Thermoanaerobaculia bacterium]|nr:hypothetical protein [Thermoanaerobaculia bacterium]